MTDEAIMLILMFFACFTMLWYKGTWIKVLIADLLFMVMGIAMYTLGSLNYPWGIMVSFIAMIHLIFHVMNV